MSQTSGTSTSTENFSFQGSAGFGGAVQNQYNNNLTTSYGNGTTAGNIDQLYAKRLTFVASTPQAIDLTNFTQPDGTAGNMARVNHYFFNIVGGTDGQNLAVGANGTNPWAGFLNAAGILAVCPGAPVKGDAPLATGWPTSGTSKVVKLDPGANAMVVDVLFAGRSL